MLTATEKFSKLIVTKDKHTIKLFSPAKVNLSLKVLGRLKNGYHLITKPFNVEELQFYLRTHDFKVEYDLHRNNPSIIFIP